MDPQTYRFRVGSVACLVVADGTNLYDDPGDVLFANAPRRNGLPRCAPRAYPPPGRTGATPKSRF